MPQILLVQFLSDPIMNPRCEIKSYHVISPVGVWKVDECVVGLHWVKLDKDQGSEIDTDLEIKIVEDNVKKTELLRWLTVYFEDIDNLDAVTLPRVCPVVFSKNRFKEKVWREIYENLHVGETATYGEIAKRCGSPGASQVSNTYHASSS